MNTTQKYVRSRVAIMALAYEKYNHSFITDVDYDALSLLVDVSIPTDRPNLDKWFEENYDANTGMWVLTHPELNKLHLIVSGMISLVGYNNTHIPHKV